MTERPAAAPRTAPVAPPSNMGQGHENTLNRRYHRVQKVGEGTYGVVYKARDNMKGTFVALKKIRIDGEDEGVPSTAIREISLLKDLVHENVVTLEDVVVVSASRIYLVFEFLAKISSVTSTTVHHRDSRDLVNSYLYQLPMALLTATQIGSFTAISNPKSSHRSQGQLEDR